MEILIKVVQFFMSLSLLVAIHEFGHFIVARIFKIRVEKFYIFFDPWFSLFKWKRGDTEYGVGWLPLGGYVKIAGMIDDGLTRIKVAFKEQVGEFDVHEAADILVDRMAARAIAVVERAIDVGLPIAAKKLASVLALNPYTAPLAPIVETVVPYVAEPIKKIVVTGIKVFAEKSKPIIHKTIDKVKEIATKVGTKLKKILLS